MAKSVVREYATTSGKPGGVYFLLDKPVAGKSGVANPQTRKLPIGKRYLVSISVSSKGTRRILGFDEVSHFAGGGIPKDKTASETLYIPPPGIEKYFPVPEKDPNYFLEQETHETIMAILKAYKGRNANVFLLGPPGVGKTSMAQFIAASIGYNYFEFQTAQVREPMDWIGRLIPENGSVEFQENLLMAAISVPKTIVCLNEMNRVEPNMHNAVFELLSDRRSSYFDEMGKEVKVAKDVHFFITMNTNHDNIGTFGMDTAMWDRATGIVEISFLEWDPVKGKKKEAEIIAARTGANMVEVEKIVALANHLRKEWKDGKIPLPPSFRWNEAAARLVASGLDWKYVLNTTFLRRYSNDGGEDSYRVYVRNVIKGKFPELK